MILQYNPAMSTMVATTMADQSKNEAFCAHSSVIGTQALFFTFKVSNFGMLSINEKNQEPGMITWNRKA